MSVIKLAKELALLATLAIGLGLDAPGFAGDCRVHCRPKCLGRKCGDGTTCHRLSWIAATREFWQGMRGLWPRCKKYPCPPLHDEFFGYYPTCWRPWPDGWHICPVSPPLAEPFDAVPEMLPSDPNELSGEEVSAQLKSDEN